jgi:hypothetical protein
MFCSPASGAVRRLCSASRYGLTELRFSHDVAALAVLDFSVQRLNPDEVVGEFPARTGVFRRNRYMIHAGFGDMDDGHRSCGVGRAGLSVRAHRCSFYPHAVVASS